LEAGGAISRQDNARTNYFWKAMALPLAVERLMSPQWEASQAKIVGTEVSKLVEVSTFTVTSVLRRRRSGIAVKEICSSRMQLI
jgi:hypothetical protein